MNRRDFLSKLGVALAGVAMNGVWVAETKPAGKPNIILMMTDDQGYSDLSCYGSPNIKTPNLDRMAAEGVRFTDYYAAGSVCTTTRASLMTGCYPKRVGFHKGVLPTSSEKGLHPDEVTIAELLRGQGYATACVAKWHLGTGLETLPTSQGFDSYFGMPGDNHGKGALYRGTNIIEQAGKIEINELTQRYTTEAIEFIKNSKDKPFFLYLPHGAPHTPLYASKNFRGKSAAGGGAPDPAARFRGPLTYDFGVTNVTWEAATPEYSYVTFDLSWSYSWRLKWTEPAKTSATGKDMEVENWDAAWVFVKFLPEKDSEKAKARNHWLHATLASSESDHVMPAGATNRVKLSDDPSTGLGAGGRRGIGLYIFRDAIGHGRNDWKGIKLRWMHGADTVDPAKAAADRKAVVSVLHDTKSRFDLTVWVNDAIVFKQGKNNIKETKPFTLRKAGNTLMPECRSAENAAAKPGVLTMQFSGAGDGHPIHELLLDIEQSPAGL